MTILGLTAAQGLTLCVEVPEAMSVPPEWPLLAAAYVTGAQAGPPSAQPDVRLTLNVSPEPYVRQVSGYVEVGVPHGASFPGDVYHILHTMARAAWMHRGMYAAHAACVHREGRTVLLVGPSGSGKSTVTLALMHRGAAVFSGNTTLVGFPPQGGMWAYGGTDVLTLRADHPACEALNGGIRYGGRYAVRFPAPPPGPLGVDAIVCVRLNDGVAEAHALPPGSAAHTLYPAFMGATQADVIVGEGVGVISPEVPLATRSRLAAQLFQTVMQVPVWHVAGSLNHIVACVEEMI